MTKQSFIFFFFTVWLKCGHTFNFTNLNVSFTTVWMHDLWFMTVYWWLTHKPKKKSILSRWFNVGLQIALRALNWRGKNSTEKQLCVSDAVAVTIIVSWKMNFSGEICGCFLRCVVLLCTLSKSHVHHLWLCLLLWSAIAFTGTVLIVCLLFGFVFNAITSLPLLLSISLTI